MTDKSITYDLKYLISNNVDQPTNYSSGTKLDVGDIIEVDSFGFYCIVKVNDLELELSENAPDPTRALYFAVQRGHISEH